jgi:ABC-type spermidine/putrescine transport system permease subunit II
MNRARLFGLLAPLEVAAGVGVTLILVSMCFHSPPVHQLTDLRYVPMGDALRETLLVCLPMAIAVTAVGYLVAYAAYTYFAALERFIVVASLTLYFVSYYAIALGWRIAWATSGAHAGTSTLAAMVSDWFGYGRVSVATVMTLRYVGVAIVLLYLRLRALPRQQLAVARNLGLGTLLIHWRLCLPWVADTLVLVFLFSLLLGTVDSLAPTVVGGGTTQTLGILVEDFYKAMSLRPIAFEIGLFHTVAALTLGAILLPGRGLTYYATAASAANDPAQRRFSTEVVPLAAILVVTGVLSAVPFLAVIAAAFGAGAGVFPTADGFSMLLPSAAADPNLQQAIWTTLWVASIAALAAVILALFSTIALHFRAEALRPNSARYFSALRQVSVLPLIMPPLLLGMALAALQGTFLHLEGSWISVAVVHTAIYSPLAYFILAACLRSMPPHSLTVAMNLAVPLPRFLRRVLWPILRGTLPIAAAVVFALSSNDSTVARFVGGFDRTVGVLIADQQLAGLRPEHFALIVIVACLSLLTAAIPDFDSRSDPSHR